MTWLLLISLVIFLFIGGFFLFVGWKNLSDGMEIFIPIHNRKSFMLNLIMGSLCISVGFSFLGLVYWCWTYISITPPISNILKYGSKWLV